LLVLFYFNFNFLAFFDKIYSVKDSATKLAVHESGASSIPMARRRCGESTKPGRECVAGPGSDPRTAGLPHILMRFFTVPNAKAARTSVAWAMD